MVRGVSHRFFSQDVIDVKVIGHASTHEQLAYSRAIVAVLRRSASVLLDTFCQCLSKMPSCACLFGAEHCIVRASFRLANEISTDNSIGICQESRAQSVTGAESSAGDDSLRLLDLVCLRETSSELLLLAPVTGVAEQTLTAPK